MTKEEQSFVDLKKAFDLYERNKLIKEKFEIQLESLKLKKDQAQDKLDRFNKDKEKFEENKKIDETILRADMRLDDLQREKEGVNYEITTSQSPTSKNTKRRFRTSKTSLRKSKRKRRNSKFTKSIWNSSGRRVSQR